jgi:hypothetical protein
MSSDAHAPQATTVGHLRELKCRIHRIAPFLDQVGEQDTFRTKDLDFDAYHEQKILEIMRRCGLLHVTREKYRGRNRCIYHWNDDVKHELEQYRADLDTLPCGHRVHVYHTHDGRYGCRYCDAERDYDRDLIESLL